MIRHDFTPLESAISGAVVLVLLCTGLAVFLSGDPWDEHVPQEPRLYEVACEGPLGWARYSVDYNVYGEPRTGHSGAMRFETTDGRLVKAQNCLASCPAEWSR